MELHDLIQICLSLVLATIAMAEQEGQKTVSLDIRMPGVWPNKEDEYMCTSKHVPVGDMFIVNFQALASADRAHHMLLFGCKTPHREEGESWQCGGICESGEKSKILFAWAKNANPTKLPESVGFEVGGESDIDYFVLQIHYKKPISRTEKGDMSGLRLTMTNEKQKYNAGIYILLSENIKIPPHRKNVHADISCRFEGQAPIHPFAFRPHAHTLGVVISGYKKDEDQGPWEILGKGNPQWPQAFYPMDQVHTINPGDRVAARCTYNSMTRSQTTYIGGAHTDEMCNFYMMYYTEVGKGGDVYYDCFDNRDGVTLNLPSDSDTPLPPNPKLEEQAKGKKPIANDHTTGVKLTEGWPVDKNKIHFGQIAGVHTDSQDNVLLFHRGPRKWGASTFDALNKFTEAGQGPIAVNTIVTFNKDGHIIEQWGKNLFYLPHGLTVDNHDNIWVTDVAMHQVFKFNKGSRTPALTLGKLLEPGSDEEHFCKPTDVAVLSSGEFFVADGYCNSRIMKYSPDGKLLKHWGRSSEGVRMTDGLFPPPMTMAIPHSITALEDKGQVCVADREDGRILYFTFNGDFVKQIHPEQFNGRLFAVNYSPATGDLYAVNGPSMYGETVMVEGFTLDGDTGHLKQTWSPHSQPFDNPHDLVVSRDGKCIYVVEIGPNKIWKFHIEGGQTHKTITNKVEPKPQNTTPAKSPSSSTSQHKNSTKITRPSSVDSSSDDTSDKKLEEEEGDDFKASIVIGTLLVVPITVVVIITIILRMRKNAARRRQHRYKLMETDMISDDEDVLYDKQ